MNAHRFRTAASRVYTPTGTTLAIAIDEDFRGIDVPLRISLYNFERLRT